MWVEDGASTALGMPPGGGGEVDPATGARLAELHGERLGRFPAERQGRGLGAAVLAPVLERCDAEGALAVTDTSTPEKVAFDGRRGVAVTDGWDEPGGAPHVWLLARPPRAQA